MKGMVEMQKEFNHLKLRPFCNDCGWRKGGIDSWNGVTCKCGFNEPVIEECKIIKMKGEAINANEN